jgi:hypothetical protein
MSTQMVITIAASVTVAVLTMWYVVRIVRAWHDYGGVRIVTCPETGRPAAVRIDAAHAAMTTAAEAGHLRLASCSRWGTRGQCDEPCRFEAADPGCTAAAIASRWFAGKRCAYCGKQVVDEPFAARFPAILGPEGDTREWVDVNADQLPDALQAGAPVCWDCHIAETFRRKYPSLVTDRTNVNKAS